MRLNQDDLKITIVLKLASKPVTEPEPVPIYMLQEWMVSADPSAVDRALDELVRDEDTPVECDCAADCVWIRDLAEAADFIKTFGTELPWGTPERGLRARR